MAAFHEVRFPVKISFGSSGGPGRKTDIVELSSGYEERNSPWLYSKHTFNVAYGIRSMNQIYLVKSFWEARHGQLYGFRYKDWSDYKSCAPDDVITPTDQIIGTGDGVTASFQLKKVYTSGLHTYTRLIRKPVAGTVRIAVNGVELDEGWTIDTTTGIITFDNNSFNNDFNNDFAGNNVDWVPDVGDAVTAGFEFDVPVRFDSEELTINLAEWRAGQISDIPLKEIRV